MANFQARERQELNADSEKTSTVVPIAPPRADKLDYAGMDGRFNYHAPKDHTREDVLSDDYFDKVIDKNRAPYIGATVWCTVQNGSLNPEDWEDFFVRVVAIRGTKGESTKAATRVALVKFW